MKTLLVTGGAGFIGSAYVCMARSLGYRIINLDKLTYSGNRENLISLENDDKHIFVQGDIGDAVLVGQILKEYTPDAVINFAAESHVDRSIIDPDAFVHTNVLGTCTMLRTIKIWWENLENEKKQNFRFLHISTDEVFGALKADGVPFTEKTPFAPNSPYSASKASSDHFVRAYFETYAFPTLITNCSNNYGPRQFPEKLIPLIMLNALLRKALPVYGAGANIRDWLHVDDHCSAIHLVLEKGRIGETYVVGGNSERTNLDVVKSICNILDELKPSTAGSYEELIHFVTDRLGHDFRYAIDCTKLSTELGWKAIYNFEDGLKSTIQWYLENTSWVENVQSGEYRKWIQKNYTERI